VPGSPTEKIARVVRSPSVPKIVHLESLPRLRAILNILMPPLFSDSTFIDSHAATHLTAQLARC
jgi:hypothetical protein